MRTLWQRPYESAEANYEELKNRAVNASARDAYRLIRMHVGNQSIGEIYSKLEKVVPVSPLDRKAPPGMLKAFKEAKKILDEGRLGVEEEVKDLIYEKVDQVITASEAIPGWDLKISESLSRILESEFGSRIANISSKEAGIRAYDGNVEVVNVSFEKAPNGLRVVAYKKTEMVFPVDSAILIETSTILAYGHLSGESRIYDSHFQDLLKG